MINSNIHKRFAEIAILAILVIAFSLSFHVAADADTAWDNPIKSDDFDNVVKGIANFITRVGYPAVVLAIVFTGVMFVLAQGNEEKLKQARTMFFWVITGAAIVIGARVLAEIVINFAEKL